MHVSYLGSVYEGVNICEDTIEFHVMFVADGRYMKLVTDPYVKKGYSYIKPHDEMHNLDRQLSGGFLDPNKYSQYFFGIIQIWISKMGKDEIKLRKHGVATQIDVYKDGHIWYHVDLVPSFEIGD